MAILTVDKSPIRELETGLTSNAVASDNPIRWEFSGAQEPVNVDTFDISTAVFNQSFDISNQELTSTGLSFNNNGSKVYIVGIDSDSIHEYDLSTNYDI